MVEKFSKRELNLLSDADILLLKNEVSRKVISKLAETEAHIKSFLKGMDFKFPPRTMLKSGKISKGENYKGLPWFILDYPRRFSKTSVFAYRTMLWWGHEISFTLHLQDEAYHQFSASIIRAKSQLDDYFLCVNNTPWEYDFSIKNYRPIEDMSQEDFESSVQRTPFLKVAAKQPVSRLDDIDKHAVAHLELFLKVLSGA